MGRTGRSRHLDWRLDPDTLARTTRDELTALIPIRCRLPRRIERIASAAEHGRLSVNVRLFADGGPAVTDSMSLYELLGYNLLVVSAILALRVLATSFRHHG